MWGRKYSVLRQDPAERSRISDDHRGIYTLPGRRRFNFLLSQSLPPFLLLLHTMSDATDSVISAASRKLAVPGVTGSHLVQDAPGYTTPVFKGKGEQRAQVEQDIVNKV